jgi:hypothetical protein
MSLTETDAILVDPAAIEYIAKKELEEGSPLLKFQVIEYFFEWLSKQPAQYQMQFLREALRE